MKKTLILVVMAFLFIGAIAVAEVATVVDFQLLNADIIADKAGEMTQNRRTVMDFGVVAGASYTDDQKKMMRTSLAIGEWDVVLNSSAKTAVRTALSYTKEAEVSSEAQNYAGQKLMGIRIKFPEWAHNANATIEPRFPIPAFAPMTQVDDSGNLQEPTAEDKASGKSRFEGGYGVVKNTGVIKSVSVNTYGMNFPHGLYVLFRDQNRKVTRYFMGYLLFDGWREMIWNNPAYISQVRSREVRLYPVYPTSLPHVAFAGFLITKDAAHDGGDAIAYFKDVKIIYDKAVLTNKRDFADEDIWGIQTKNENDRRKIEVEKFGNLQVLQWLEKEKMAKPEETFEAAEGENEQAEPAPAAGDN